MGVGTQERKVLLFLIFNLFLSPFFKVDCKNIATDFFIANM